MLGKRYDAAYERGYDDGYSAAIRAVETLLTSDPFLPRIREVRTQVEDTLDGLKWEPMTGGKVDEVQDAD